MATTIINGTPEIKLLPITGLELDDGTDTYEFYQLEAECRWSVTPKIKNHYKYGLTLIGWTIDFKIWIPQNQYDTNGILTALNTWKTTALTIRIGLGEGYLPNTPAEEKIAIYNSSGSLWLVLPDIRISHGVEPQQYRPRLYIEGRKNVKALTGGSAVFVTPS